MATRSRRKPAPGAVAVDGVGLPHDGSAAEGRCGSVDGVGLPHDGSAAEGRCGSIDVSVLLRPPPAPDVHQERARRSHQALIDAAVELFERDGYDKVGTPELAERAGVSVGTFYRYFADKHVLYVEVVRRMLSTAYAEILAGLTPTRFLGRARTQTIEDAVALLFEHILRRPELSRSMMEMSLRDPDVAEMRRAFEYASVARLTELVTTVTPRAEIPDPEATASVLYGACMHCAYTLAGHVGPPSLSPARAKAALVAFLERALFPPAP